MSSRLTNQVELPALAAHKLRELIVNQKLTEGDRFPSEIEMIKMFGVGRSTIREAVKILVTENVVQIQRGRGTFVCGRPGMSNDPLGLHFADQNKLIYNLFETRLVVEPPIAFLAAERATQENIDSIRGILNEFDNLSPADNEAFSQLDIQLHTMIAHCTQNDVLYRFLPSICDAIFEGSHETLNNKASQKRARESHKKIFAAIKNHNPGEARTESEKHIRLTAEDAKIFLGGNLS